MYINFFSYDSCARPHQSEALGGCLVCLCLRPALMIPQTFTVTAEHIRFYFFSSVFHFSVVVSVR